MANVIGQSMSLCKDCAESPPKQPDVSGFETLQDWDSYVMSLVTGLIVKSPHGLHRDIMAAVSAATAMGAWLGTLIETDGLAAVLGEGDASG